MTTQAERVLQLAMDYASAQRAGNLHKSREAWDALKAAVEAMAVPKGWRMVPDFPTDEMIAVGVEWDEICEPQAPAKAVMLIYTEMVKAAPAAMIQAAPEVPR